MHVMRTPDAFFNSLESFNFAPHYEELSVAEVGALRAHFLDEGPHNGEVVLLMHGEPSWSYLYRKVIPPLVERGFRCIAPDLIGFGRSDKPSDFADYTYARHVSWMEELLIHRLELDNITLFCQDWGGLIGLRLVAAYPERFARVIVSNTGLPTGDQPMSKAFMAWQEYSQTAKEFNVGGIIKGGCVTNLSPEIVAAYNAPFPDDTYKAGARVLPSLVPTRPMDPASDANRAAWDVLKGFKRPFICAFSDSDPITSGGGNVFRKLVPGCASVDHITIAGGGHFVQEDHPEEVAAIIASAIERYPIN